MVGSSLGETFVFEDLSALRFNWEHRQLSLWNKRWVLWNILDLSSDVPRSARSVSKGVRPELDVTLTFQINDVSGSTGCNSYRAFLSISGGIYLHWLPVKIRIFVR